MGTLILYGRGLIAEEYCRYLEARGRGSDIAAFAVTRLDGQGETYCGRPCLEIGEALARFRGAEIHLSLQEKFHAEVTALLQEMGKTPKETIGLRRMTELLGEQALKQISAACPNLTAQWCPYDYSTLEIADKEHPNQKFTFYPMCQVPLSEDDIENLQQIVRDFYTGHVTGKPYLHCLCGGAAQESAGLHRRGISQAVEGGKCRLYLAMATSLKDASVSHEDLPEYIHPVMGGAADYVGTRSENMAYDDEFPENISHYNSFYSELTVAHWLYQKAPDTIYLGLCHYRRHFILTDEIRAALAAEAVDVLLPRPRLTFPNVRAFFTEQPVGHMERLDYETMMALLEKRDENMEAFAENLFSGQLQFPNNMVIARRDIYLDYCGFLFDILPAMQAYYKEKNVDRPKRYLGNVGEMLTALYFACNKDKWRIEYIDYQLLE